MVRITAHIHAGVARHGCGERLDVEPLPHLIDLSLLPHVSVVDTVEPPALERVGEPVHAAAKVCHVHECLRSSLPPCWKPRYHYPEVIRAAVDQPLRSDRSRSGFHQSLNRSTPRSRYDCEILSLFVLKPEVAQSNSDSLGRLDTTVNKHAGQWWRRFWQSVGNLARSAATVGFNRCRRDAYRLFPLLEAPPDMSRPWLHIMSRHFEERFVGIGKTIARAGNRLRRRGNRLLLIQWTGRMTRRQPAMSQWHRRQANTSRQACGDPTASCAFDPRCIEAVTSGPWTFRVSRCGTSSRRRIDRAGGRSRRRSEAGRCATHRTDAGELDTLDERFLEHMQARVPKVIDTLRRITRAGEERPLRPQALEPIFEDIDDLSGSAEQVCGQYQPVS